MTRSDTSPKVQKLYDDLWRRLSPSERFMKGLALSHLSRQMIIAGIKSPHPNLTPRQLKQKLQQQLYPECTIK
jgi:hypothetical protein